MWIAKFVLCTTIEGCLVIGFEDQKEFFSEAECATYTEEKSNLVVDIMNEYGAVGQIFYDCKLNKDGIET